jgi:acylphosphatase
MTLERREVYYSGRVQGVGFRYTACEIAGRFAVTGYVENLGDGRVHLVVEGESADVGKLLAAVEQRMNRLIEGQQVQSWPATSEFTGFTIRR